MNEVTCHKALLCVAMAALLGACAAHRSGAQAAGKDPAAVAGAHITGEPNGAPATGTKPPPLYPEARIDTSQGENGVLDQPALQMSTHYYIVDASWRTVSHWYLTHSPGWKSFVKPGGGDLTLGRRGASPGAIMVFGDATGTEIVIERFHTKR